MMKLMAEIEFDHYTAFGRTNSKASVDMYDTDGAWDDTDVERIITNIRKLFTNKSLFNQCVSFAWYDTDNGYRTRKYTGRIFTFNGGSFTVVIWNDHGEVIEKFETSSVTKKVIMKLLTDCMVRAQKESEMEEAV